TITYLSDTGCLEIQGASLTGKKVYLKSGKVQLTNSGSDPLVGVVWADAGTSAEEVPVKLNV
ncbi:hypothetical protein HEO19_022980, partial [Escherichia coli]|nr:hypothetical protein [Escherichia coli]